MKKYRHKKTGKLYSLVQERFLIKENGQWRDNFVLYKAEYENPDGPYFSRTKEDFFENFEEVEEKECLYSKENYNDEDRAVLCEDCSIEDCKFNSTNKK